MAEGVQISGDPRQLGFEKISGERGIFKTFTFKDQKDGEKINNNKEITVGGMLEAKGLDIISEKTENKAPLNKIFTAAKKRWTGSS